MMFDKIYFNFSYLALKLLGSGLYSNPWNAISELVANGFDAGASDVYVYIEKKEDGHSLVEIFDNGSGMNYDDLVNKYAFIGRNKRNDSSDLIEGVLPTGRKGIGKLATLYLSNNINIISKKDGLTTSWNINLLNTVDNEKPSINPVDGADIIVHSKETWSSIRHGFFIQMNNVNLNGLGEKTAIGLSNRLSDFYLLHSTKRRIWISLNSEEEKSGFILAKKSISYKNFYALFNNSSVVFPGFEHQRVKIKTNYKELQEGYPTVNLDSRFFNVSGRKKFLGINGELIEKDFCLVGWIGIHTSINAKEARQNDETFIKNKVTSPNRLRLYVREKLAVENFLDYIKNTQAFSNYIEGEISFDILDDDDLPDIATANRQQMSEKDERVRLLIDLLSPIVSKLINLRVKLANMLKEDEEKIRNKELEDLNIRHKIELDEKDEQIKKAKEKLKTKDEQIIFLSKGLRKNELRLASALHTIDKNSLTIKGKIGNIIKKVDNEKILNRFKKDIANVGLLNDRTLLLTKYAFKGKFDLKSKMVPIDVGIFVRQYLSTIIDFGNELNCDVLYDEDNPIRYSFDVTSLGIIIDNIVSNSKKANATKLKIKIKDEDGFVTLVFEDNGEGYDKSIFSNSEELFEIGVRNSASFGYGIGLFHIREIATKHSGKAYIDETFQGGFRIIVILKGDRIE